MVGSLREGLAAGRSLWTLLQLGVERLNDFIFLLELLTQPTGAHEDEDQPLDSKLSASDEKIKHVHNSRLLLWTLFNILSNTVLFYSLLKIGLSFSPYM